MSEQPFTSIAATRAIRDRVAAIRDARSSELARRVTTAEVLEMLLDHYESTHPEGETR